MTDASSSQLNDLECVHCGERHPLSWSHCPTTGKTLATGRALVGRVIAGRYRVVGLLGEGGMGAVYAAEHLMLGRRVALKRLHPELACDESSIARFHREARAAAATGHDNIVDVIDMGLAEDGAPFLVMEYLQGENLAATLKREKRLAATRACDIAIQVLDALDAVHRAGVIHRDLKPDNVFLTKRAGRSDAVKILDFGVSKMRAGSESETSTLTRTGVTVGTPHYMSPEQARGMRAHDYRVDLYAVGVMLYECLSGKLPFQGDNYHALLQDILAGTPPSLASITPEVPRDLVRVVHKAIAREPDARFASAAAMRDALVPFASGHGANDEPISQRLPRLHDPSASPTAVVDLAPMAARHEAFPSSRRTPGTPPLTEAYSALLGDDPAFLESLDRTTPRPRAISHTPRRYSRASPDWSTIRVPPSLVAPPSLTREASARYEPSTIPPAGPRLPTPRRPPPMQSGAPLGTPTANVTVAHGSPTKVKASFVAVTAATLREIHGVKAFEKLARTLPEGVADAASGITLPFAWVDLQALTTLLHAAHGAFGGTEEDLAYGIGEAIAAREIPTSQRLFLQTATPTLAIQRIPQIFRAYHDRGEARFEAAAHLGWRVEFDGLHPDTVAYANLLAGFHAKLVELCGARDVKANVVASRARGDAKTALVLRWR